MTATDDIRFTCTDCTQPIAAPWEMAGQRIDCPSCRKMLWVPKTKRIHADPPPFAFQIADDKRGATFFAGGFIACVLLLVFMGTAPENHTPGAVLLALVAIIQLIYFRQYAGFVLLVIGPLIMIGCASAELATWSITGGFVGVIGAVLLLRREK